MSEPQKVVLQLQFWAEEKKLFSCSNDNSFRIFNIDAENITKYVEDNHINDPGTKWKWDEVVVRNAHKGEVSCFDLQAKSGTFVTSSADDSRIKIWDLNRLGDSSPVASKVTKEWACDAGPVHDVIVARDCSTIISASGTQGIYFWDRRSASTGPSQTLKFKPSEGEMYYRVTQPMDNYIITASGRNEHSNLIIWDIRKGMLQSQSCASGFCFGLQADSEKIVTGAWDEYGVVWNWRNGLEKRGAYRTPKGASGLGINLWAIEWLHFDDGYLVTSHSNGYISTYDFTVNEKNATSLTYPKDIGYFPDVIHIDHE